MVANIAAHFVAEGSGGMTLGSIAGKRITVTGASGFVGTNLIPELVARGAQVRAIIHQSPLRLSVGGVQVVKADLSTTEGCREAAEDTDIFVMAAANSSGAEVMATRPLTHLTPNVVMNALSLEAAHAAGVSKYCFISSSTVYPPGDEEMAENDATGEFFDSYEVVASMKLFSERMVGYYSSRVSRPMDTLIVRPSNLYGPHDKFSREEAKVIPALIRRAVAREEPFEVWGSGKDIKDFLYISDFVGALVEALSFESRHEVFNVASGVSVRLRDIIPLVLEHAGHEGASIVYDSSKPAMIPVRRLSNGKCKELLGWEPDIEISDGLRRTVQWFQENSPAAAKVG